MAKQQKLADLQTLQGLAASGEIVLKYLDEAGFSLWSDVSYSYTPIGEQKCLEQTAQRYGSRISILGRWEPTKEFDYALVQKGFKSDSYIKVMEEQAKKAKRTLESTHCITVIVQDNAPIHTSKKTREK